MIRNNKRRRLRLLQGKALLLLISFLAPLSLENNHQFNLGFGLVAAFRVQAVAVPIKQSKENIFKNKRQQQQTKDDEINNKHLGKESENSSPKITNNRAVRNLLLSPLNLVNGAYYLHLHYLDIAWLVFSRAATVLLGTFAVMGATGAWAPEHVHEFLFSSFTRYMGALYAGACCYLIPCLAISALIFGPPFAMVFGIITKSDVDPLVVTAFDYLQHLREVSPAWREVSPVLEEWGKRASTVVGNLVQVGRDIQMNLFGSIAPQKTVFQTIYILAIVPIVEGFIFRYMFNHIRSTWTRLFAQQPDIIGAPAEPSALGWQGSFKFLFGKVVSLAVTIFRSIIVAVFMTATFIFGAGMVGAWMKLSTFVDPVTLLAGAIGFFGLAITSTMQPMLLFSKNAGKTTNPIIIPNQKQGSFLFGNYPGWVTFSSLLAATTRLYHWYAHEDLLYGTVNIHEVFAVPRLAFALAHIVISFQMNAVLFWPLYLTKGFAASVGAHVAWNMVGFKPRTMPLLFGANILIRIMSKMLVGRDAIETTADDDD